jgi:hypothetical protein
LRNAAFVNFPSIHKRFSRGSDAEAHSVALDINDSDADIALNDDLLTYFAREHKHNSPPCRRISAKGPHGSSASILR